MVKKTSASEAPQVQGIEKIEADRILLALPSALPDKKIAYIGSKDMYLIGELVKRGVCAESLDNTSDALPRITLESKEYDYVLCIRSIAKLKTKEQRLLMMELARILKEEGEILISSSLDYRTEDPALRLAKLIQTEFMIEESALFNERLYYSVHHLLTAPEKFIRASKEAGYREKKVAEKSGLSKMWFQMNSAKPMVYIWRAISPIFSFVQRSLNREWLERVSQFLFQEGGLSHVLFSAKLKPIIEASEEERNPKIKEKKWE